jgi:hypothetical protein
VRDFAVADFTFNAQVHIHCWEEHSVAQFKSRNATWGKK